MESAYILHTRPYTDSQLIANLLVTNMGRVNAIIRHTSGKHSIRGILQPFQPLHIILRGKSSLKNISMIEAASPAIPLNSNALFSSIYINELIVRLLYQDQGENIFNIYHETLINLATDFNEADLRYFELALVDELGEKPSLSRDVDGKLINSSNFYNYIYEHGFSLSENGDYPGDMILQLNRKELKHTYYKIAKHFCRILLQPKLGDKPLISREFFS